MPSTIYPRFEIDAVAPGAGSRTVSVFAVVIICAAKAAPRTSGAQTRADSSRPRTGGHARVALTHALPRLNGGRLKVSGSRFGTDRASPQRPTAIPAP